MKKNYQKPAVEAITVDADIITASYVKVISLNDAEGGVSVDSDGYIKADGFDFQN